MATARQVAANTQNAAQSPGPQTPEGKRRSSQNALRHGLRSEVPVLPGERAEDWEGHRDSLFQSLAPAGALEEALAERVVLALWRLRRLARFETAVTTLGIEEAREKAREKARRQADEIDDSLDRLPSGATPSDLALLAKAEKELEEARSNLSAWAGALDLLERLQGLPAETPVVGDDANGALQDLIEAASETATDLPDVEDEAFLAALGIPEDERERAYEWDGWTAALVRKGLERLAVAARLQPQELLARALRDSREAQEETQGDIRELEGQVRNLRRRARRWQERLQQRRLLPEDRTLEKVTRYEAHLSRQLFQALHELERLQASRAGEPVPPPAALDVTVNGELPTSQPAALEGPDGA